jgi:hypothetical protein
VHPLVACGTAPALPTLYRQLRAAGREVQVVDTAEEAVRLLESAACEALILEVKEELPANLGTLSGAAGEKLILLVQGPTDAGLQELGKLPGLGTVISEQQELSGDELFHAVSAHLRHERFGLERHFGAGTQIHRMALSDSAARGEAIDALDGYLNEVNLDPRLVGQLLTVADEFVTNAFYNAPMDESGRHCFSHLSRIEPVQMPPDRPVEISWGCDGRRVAIGVRDRYGSLERATLLRHLAKALGEAQASFGTSGAGLGLVTAFHAASRLIFNLSPGRSSECIGVIDVGSYRQFIEQGKGFQIFNFPSGVNSP